MMDRYNTMTFAQIWDDSDEFADEYKASPLYDYEPATTTTPEQYHNSLHDKNIEILFALLYARYGNSPIANADVNQFKFKIFSTIFKYGPAWEKKLEIQDEIRQLDKNEITKGNFSIYNHAFNDAGDPGTDSTEALQYVNDQNTSRFIKSPLEGYMIQWDALTVDVTEAFINKFKICFKQFVSPEFGPRIMSDIDEED